MTPEEAIKTIQVAIAEVEWNYPIEYAIAFETAIKALEIANRYQEELERFKTIIQSKLDMIHDLQEELDRFKIENQSLRGWANSYKLHYNEAKSEAVKEFAERAKEHFLKLEYKANTKRKTVKVEELEEQMEWVLHTVAIKTLYTLVKEMEGDTE